MKPTSCGFLIKSNDLYLLGHTTQSDKYCFNPKDRYWTIPKGIVNDGESFLDTAIRETIEETAFDVRTFFTIDPTMTPFATITTKHKINHIFSLNDTTGKLTQRNFWCDSLIYNKRLPHMDGKPEIDMFIWANREQAKSLVHKSLKVLFD